MLFRSVSRVRLAGATDGAGMDPALQLEDERVNYKVLQSTEELQAKDLEDTKAELKRLDAIEAPALALSTELKNLKESYDKYIAATRDAQVNADLDSSAVSNVKIVQAATQPDRPIAPRRTRNIALTLFFALVAGVGLAFVREFFDDTVKSREDVEKKLGLTVLAVVPAEEFLECI